MRQFAASLSSKMFRPRHLLAVSSFFLRTRSFCLDSSGGGCKSTILFGKVVPSSHQIRISPEKSKFDAKRVRFWGVDRWRLVTLFERADAMPVREAVRNARGCRNTSYVDA